MSGLYDRLGISSGFNEAGPQGAGKPDSGQCLERPKSLALQ